MPAAGCGHGERIRIRLKFFRSKIPCSLLQGLQKQLFDSAMAWGADYFGIADLSPAHDTVREQGGRQIAAYPRSISVGIALLHSIVNQLSSRPERAVAVSYRSHCYDIINARLGHRGRRFGLPGTDGRRLMPEVEP